MIVAKSRYNDNAVMGDFPADCWSEKLSHPVYS